MKLTTQEILDDYKLACLSRNMSLTGRKEVLSGKAKFGIFGDGKEVPQIAMAKFFQNGDFRSGYYRDQSFVMAAGLLTPEELFAQLYGDTDLENNRSTGGRLMNNHFASHSIDEKGSWKNLTEQKNSVCDISPTAGQMARLVGLAYASKLYRENPELKDMTKFSNNGNEVAFGAIGDASTSEGHFFEVINALGVMQAPMALAVWDDGYGISVPVSMQTTKQSISEVLRGFERNDKGEGILIYKEKGWNYKGLVDMFEEGIRRCREEHIPVVFHIDELTQPLGHSSSGSHERYKDADRLKWEADFDCIRKMREWILDEGIASYVQLDEIEQEAQERSRIAKNNAWESFISTIKKERDEFLQIIEDDSCQCKTDRLDKISEIKEELKRISAPIRKDILVTAKKVLRYICPDCPSRKSLQRNLSLWLNRQEELNYERYSSHLYTDTHHSALVVKEVKPIYNSDAPIVNGREIIRDNYDALLEKDKRIVIFGEDVGNIGGVNQTYEGLQKKYGSMRVSDTGIREASIMGQGMGLAMRGLRPIAEIQYLDYLLYGLQTLSDDVACLSYRTKGRQKAPMIVTTRGHRLEGVWHSGSPMGMIINSIRGIYVCVPRNMTQAAGFYNTLLQADDPALVIEPLNAYRLKETLPANLGEFRIPLGIPEILSEGKDVTLVTYGSCVRIAQEAVLQLSHFGITVELIDVQTLLPFDIKHLILDSIKKTNRVVFFDEDVPGGATAYMMQKVMEEQGAYHWLDSAPRTITGKDHRPAYATDGDYFSNPSTENVFETIYGMMHEARPSQFPSIF